MERASKKKNKQNRQRQQKQPIKHTADTFRIFDQLKLPAPMSTADIPGILEKLHTALDSYKEKTRKWEESRKQKIEAAKALGGDAAAAVESPKEPKKE